MKRLGYITNNVRCEGLFGMSSRTNFNRLRSVSRTRAASSSLRDSFASHGYQVPRSLSIQTIPIRLRWSFHGVNLIQTNNACTWESVTENAAPLVLRTYEILLASYSLPYCQECLSFGARARSIPTTEMQCLPVAFPQISFIEPLNTFFKLCQLISEM